MSRTLILVLLTLHAATAKNRAAPAEEDLQRVVLAFPKINATDYRPDVAAQSANALIGAGVEAACATLQRLADSTNHTGDSRELDQKVCHLCRLLFLPKPGNSSLRRPRLGSLWLLPYQSMTEEIWPYLPFAIVDEIPLSVSCGYTGTGVAEPASYYLAYCKANGEFRQKAFTIPTVSTATNALSKLLTSPAWKSLKWKDQGDGWGYDLSEDDVKEKLWKQVANLKPGGK